MDLNKRIRSANYTLMEKELLLNLVSEYKSIIDNKRTDSITNRRKQNIWSEITERFNRESSNGTYRSVYSLKHLYDNTKKKISAMSTEHKEIKVEVDLMKPENKLEFINTGNIKVN